MSSKRVKDEADVLFGDGNKKYPAGNIGFPDAEVELICSLAGPELTLEEKVQIRDQYRAADKDGKWALLQEYCGPMKVGRDEVLGV